MKYNSYRKVRIPKDKQKTFRKNRTFGLGPAQALAHWQAGCWKSIWKERSNVVRTMNHSMCGTYNLRRPSSWRICFAVKHNPYVIFYVNQLVTINQSRHQLGKNHNSWTAGRINLINISRAKGWSTYWGYLQSNFHQAQRTNVIRAN